MNAITHYIQAEIRVWVWSGFHSVDKVDVLIADALEAEGKRDADPALLRAFAAAEFQKRAVAKRSWPETTDCDRLDRSFEALNSRGIISLHNAGNTISDGIGDVREVAHERGRNVVAGYCFYHGQDVARTLAGDGLMLAFGVLDDDKAKGVAIGRSIADVLEAGGLVVDWNGRPDTRLRLDGFDWKRR
ncbi:MAG: hypothetical protein KDA32_00200 [Phycisphaerales bacterium]|nr:hypothetical protein [Phycisphaerales bacterium]